MIVLKKKSGEGWKGKMNMGIERYDKGRRKREERKRGDSTWSREVS